MADELQRLVDLVAERVGRPAVLEDRRQRMIVYSEHEEPIDAVRAQSILSRHTTPEVIAFFREHDIAEATKVVRTPPAPGLDMLARVCLPIRHADLLLGFLWFVDEHQDMDDDEINVAVELVEDFALALYRENLAEELASNQEMHAARNLLIDEPEVQEHAARTLVANKLFQRGSSVVALVCQPVRRAGTEPEDLLQLAIEQALLTTRRRLGPRRALHLPRYDHGLLLVPGESEQLQQWGQRLLSSLESTALSLEAVEEVVVGVGRPYQRLADARKSYREARQAADVASQLPIVGPIAVWEDLGVYRAILHLSDGELESSTVHPGLERLVQNAEHEPLVDTLEAYLDLAGNAQETAKRLHIHRTSLYYRLQRIEEVAETDLKDGRERLALHLGLKLARLRGRHTD